MGPKNHILWLLCGGAALALHAGAAALFFGDSAEEAVPIGQKGVLVELAFEGAAAGGLSRIGNVDEKTDGQAEQVEATPPKKAEQAEPVEVLEEAAPPEEIPEPPKPEPVDTPKPKEEEVQLAEDAVEVVQEVAEQPVPAETVPTVNNNVGTEDGAEVEAVTNSVGGAGGSSAAATGSKGDGNAAQSGGTGGVIKSYEDLVQVWVHKHLLYPKSARRRQLTGTVLVRFTLTSDGRMMCAEVVEESDYSILNKSALKTIKRAVPFPAFPKEINEESRVFIIPIEYKMG